MSKDIAAVVVQPGERPTDTGELIEVGQWYWCHREQDPEDEPQVDRLSCVVCVGTNYAELHGVNGVSIRVHFDEWDKVCRYEPDAKSVIDGNVQRQRAVIGERIADVRRLTESLGVGQRQMLSNGQTESSRALCVVSEHSDAVKDYQTALTVAKEKTLPELQKEIKEARQELSAWLTAETLPLVATTTEMKGAIERIEDRIFSVELYAGLTETVERIRDGKPADISEKLHIMQRRCYMDEECIAGYRVGGIDFDKIGDFDKWLARPENYERILPYPRTIVAFRVRRQVAEREWDGTLPGIFIKIAFEQADETTFLYIRNGKQLYRLNTAIDFGGYLFPDKDEFDLTEKSWAYIQSGKVKFLISDESYQAKCQLEAEQRRKHDEWMEAHKDQENAWRYCPIHIDYLNRLNDYEPFDQSSVYYDDVCKDFSERVNSYNRIAVIIQGLYDRSTVLHPHPPVKLYSPDGFAAAVDLIYDAGLVIHSGNAPDFEAYRAACNFSLKAGSVTIGQEDAWLRAEAVKEIERRRRDWRHKMSDRDYSLTTYRPYGDPGPGLLATVAEWQPRTKSAVYRWERERRRARWGDSDPITAKFRVPAVKLLNVDAYEPGDFKKFYNDYRTRVAYLKWAPILLAAEEYHAGNLSIDGKFTKGKK